MEQTLKILTFNDILKQLAAHANSKEGKERCLTLKPYLREIELRAHQRDTTQAKRLMEKTGMPPMPAMEQIRESMEKAVRGEMLLAKELEEAGMFLAAVSRMQTYLNKGKEMELSLSYYGDDLEPFYEIREEISRSIRGERVDDYASNTLRDIRKNLELLEEKIKTKAEGLLKSQKQWLAEAFVVTRNGRFCLPVKKEFKAKIKGSVVDQSSSGATIFVEPEAILKLQDEKELLLLEEDCEERRILYVLTDRLAAAEDGMKKNLDLLVKLDFIFAKGKLSLEMNGIQPEINTGDQIVLKEARHPLLAKETCVPLDFEIGRGKRGMIITGPNTGGKTVTIKTVGLFTLMAGSGLHLPCSYANVAMRNQVLCDIGDGQAMEDNLSTFSAHIRNVLRILKRVNRESLVILDELGSGTDPAEGMGIAVAILEELRAKGCLYLATTHYPEVKTYAEGREEILSARMAFDRENLRPLYRLEMGLSGDSCALYIAKRLGMPEHMLRLAAEKAYGEKAKAGEKKKRVLEGLSGDEGRLDSDLLSGSERCLDRQRHTGNIDEKIWIPSIEKILEKQAPKAYQTYFNRGDSVFLLQTGELGIVVKPGDDQGNVLVQVKKEKRWISHKRLKLKVKAEELYPEDYDFSIIFDTVENRKARHRMGKRHQEGLEIRLDENGYGYK